MTSATPILVKTNHYEDLIDEEMIDLVAGGNPNISEYIRKLKQHEQRLRILSILDKDRGLFADIKKIIEGEYIPKCEHIKNVLAMMRTYVEVSDTEKKKFGEVMTPIWLVEEMLDKLPTNVWSNPDLKWLDPANGIGVFPSVIVSRLMVGLSEVIPDDEARYRHIVENMLHVCELQKKNMFLFMTAFDPKDEYLLNIFTGSFLSKEFDEHCKNVWGVEKFDVIVGNPPYQELKPGFKKSQAIWHFFAQNGLSHLEKNGYFCMIHPSSWREPLGIYKPLQQIILSRKVLYLQMNGRSSGISWFGSTTDCDYYVLTNSPHCEYLTEIKDQEGEVYHFNISRLPFIPNGMFDKILPLIAKNEDKRVSVLHSRSAYGHDKGHVSSDKSEKFCFPVVYTISSNRNVRTKYSNTDQNGHFRIPKVIWSNGSSDVIVDKVGEYGLTEFAYAIADDLENLENIQKAMRCSSFVELMKRSAFNNSHRYNGKVISLFRRDFWKEFI